MRRARLLYPGTLLVAALALLRCSSNSSLTADAPTPGPDGGNDGSSTTDSPVVDETDLVSDANVTESAPPPYDARFDATGDGGSDAAQCRSIDQACVDGGGTGYQCVTSWSAAQQPATWCSRFPSRRVDIAAGCDGFYIVSIGAVDTSTTYYYDTQSGALVGIEGRSILGAFCLGGQAPEVPLIDCTDGGGLSTFACESDGAVND